MTLWLYTETGAPETSGPFATLEQALDSRLWEYAGTCLWIEVYEQGIGWFYENVKWCGDHWHTTSRGLRPIEPERPQFLDTVFGKEAA